MVLEINGNATILQPRPPSNTQVNVPGQIQKPSKSFRKLVDPTTAQTSTETTVVPGTEKEVTALPKGMKLTEIVSKKILERFTAVGEAFLAFDQDRSGAITEKEIKIGLHNWGFDLSETALSDICSRFQHNEQGLIDYKAFCDYFASTLEGSGSLKLKPRHYVDPRHSNGRLQNVSKKASTEEIVDAVETELRKKLAEQFRCVRHAFLFFDEDRSGRIHMDEFAHVLQRYGIVLNQEELDELRRRVEDEHAASENSVPARKKRDAIFSSYETEDEQAIEAAKTKAEKMKSGIRYEDFVRHFGSVLQPNHDGNHGEDFHNQKIKKDKNGKRTGHNASHKIFGSKATATEGKNAQKRLATRLFAGYDELHDALVFHDPAVTGVLTDFRFIEILVRYGANKETATKLAEKYTKNLENSSLQTVDYTDFFGVLSDLAGAVVCTFFAEENIVLQIGVDVKSTSVLSQSIEQQVAMQFATREGLSRVCSTWKLFDRAGSGKIQGGEFINALRNTRAGHSMPQRGATALSELYDLDGTGRCDYVAFSRSFRKDLAAAARVIGKTAHLRRGSLLVNTTRKAAQFWKTHAVDTQRDAAAAAAAQELLLDTRQIKKRRLLLPDQKIYQLATEKKKSPRFRASFDTHNLVQKFQSELSKHWKTFTKLFRRHDTRNTGYVSPSRFAKIVISRTGTAIPKEQIERLALAFVDFQVEKKPMVSYNRFMKQLVLEPMRPQAVPVHGSGRPRRPVTRPAPAQVNTATPSRPRTTSSSSSFSTAADANSEIDNTNTAGIAQQNVARSRQRRGSKRDTTIVVAEISNACLYSIYGRWKKLRRIFAKIDAKRTGTVSIEVFCHTLQKNAFAVTQQDYLAIRTRFSNNGALEYHNFLRHVLTRIQKRQ